MKNSGFAGRLRRVLLAGLLVLVPAALTAAVLVWMFRFLDGVLGPVIARLIGRHVPGMGLVATIAVVLLLGLISSNVVGKRLVAAAESVVRRVPVARSLYGSTKEVMASLADRPADAFKRVVLIEYPRRGIWSVAFVTASVVRLRETGIDEELLTVFLPTTPNPTSGYLVLVPRSQATELDLTVEQGIRLVISGGLVRPSTWATPSAAALPAKS